VKKKMNEKCNKPADKNIKLHHVTAEMKQQKKLRARRKSSSSRYDILARASQFYCRAFYNRRWVFSVRNLQCSGRASSIEAQSAIIHRIKLMFGTARRVYEPFFSFVLN
jgi:FKBP-type peptidyl-prolyl cis-trans isomerase (trigger factor)